MGAACRNTSVGCRNVAVLCCASTGILRLRIGSLECGPLPHRAASGVAGSSDLSGTWRAVHRTIARPARSACARYRLISSAFAGGDDHRFGKAVVEATRLLEEEFLVADTTVAMAFSSKSFRPQ